MGEKETARERMRGTDKTQKKGRMERMQEEERKENLQRKEKKQRNK